jgi:hypothetical protein
VPHKFDFILSKRNINTLTKANPLTPYHCHTRGQALFARVLCQRLTPTSATSPLSPKQLMHFARMPRTPISPHTALPLCRAKCSDHPSGTRMHSVVRTRVPYPLDILTLTYSADNCPSANIVSSSHSKASIIRASAMPTSHSSLAKITIESKATNALRKIALALTLHLTQRIPSRAECSDHPSGTRMHSIVHTRVPQVHLVSSK